MENSDEYIDVDSNKVHSTDDDTADVELNDDEDDSYSVSSGSESSNDGDDADKGSDDKPVEVDVVVGDRVVSINSITSEEICAMEFGTVDEAFEFYYRYGKCKGFAVRKSDRRKDRKGSKKLMMRQFVCNKHGFRDKKHLCRIDRKREHRRLTRTGCAARLRVQYKRKKDRYVVSIFEEEIFKEVKEQIMKAGALIVKDKHENGDTKVYTLTKYCKDNYEREVVYDGSTLNCSFDSNMMELSRFGAYCSVFTNFYKEVSKKDGVYGEVIDDIMNLQKNYCSTDVPIRTQKSTVHDPIPVKGRGAPKKKKTDTKSIRHCGYARVQLIHAKKVPVEKNVELDSVSLTDFVSQTKKNKKRKTSCKGEPSVQKNCSDGPQNRGDNVTMGQISSMYAAQPMMHVIHPGGHPMQVQPVYPIYGMPVGENSNSCFGLLQQVMKSAGKE
ncbi:hypothetical protein P8452_75836 [Trifolium repens]|nr:hypothetical protein P8452_75836 [Trifolium repens]